VHRQCGGHETNATTHSNPQLRPKLCAKLVGKTFVVALVPGSLDDSVDVEYVQGAQLISGGGPEDVTQYRRGVSDLQEIVLLLVGYGQRDIDCSRFRV
jgi:hypothetical protein